MIVKTAEQIVARIEAMKEQDLLGYMTADLMIHLPYEQAAQFLREGMTLTEWQEFVQARRKDPMDDIKGYLPFAWDKANNCRGISAWRSLDHMRSWLWLAGYEKFVDSDSFKRYDRYGKKQLVVCSLLVDFDWRKQDDGNWVNDEQGLSLSKEEIVREVAWAEAMAHQAQKERVTS